MFFLALFCAPVSAASCDIKISPDGVTCDSCQASGDTFTFADAASDCTLAITGNPKATLVFQQGGSLSVTSIDGVESLSNVVFETKAELTLKFSEPGFAVPDGLTLTGDFVFDYSFSELTSVSFYRNRLHFLSGAKSSNTPPLATTGNTVNVNIATSLALSLNFLGEVWDIAPKIALTFATEGDVRVTCSNYGGVKTATAFLTIKGTGTLTVVRSEEISVNLMDLMVFEGFSSSVFDPIYTVSYCLCPNDRLTQCKSELYCAAFEVPVENYYACKSSEFAEKLANEGKITDINVYVTSFTSAEEEQYHKLTLVQVTGDMRKLNFIAADGNDTKMKLYVPAALGSCQLSFSGVTSLTVLKGFDVTGDTTIPTLSLTGTYLLVAASDKLHVTSLTSDMVSLSRIDGKLLVKSWTIVASLPASIKGVYMEGDASAGIQTATLTVGRISMTPIINLRDGGFVLTDGNEEIVVEAEQGTTVEMTIQDTNVNRTTSVQLNCGTTTTDPLTTLTFDMTCSYSLEIDNTNAVMTARTVKVTTHEGTETQTLRIGLSAKTDLLTLELSSAPINLELATLAALKSCQVDNAGLVGFLGNCEATNFAVTFGQSVSLLLDGETTPLTFNNVASKTFALQTTAKQITLNQATIADGDPQFSIVVTADGSEIQFRAGFTDTDKITVQHGNYTVTLKSPDDTVPNIGLVSSISGVLFSATQTTFDIDKNTFQKPFNGRSGPNIVVNVVGEAVQYPQSAFLAQSVAFKSDALGSLVFQYITKSAATYQFEMPVSFEAAKNAVVLAETPTDGNCLSMEFTGLVLSNSPLTASSTNQKISFSADNLETDVTSLPDAAFCSAGITAGNITIVGPDVTKVTVGRDYVQIAEGNITTPMIKAASPDSLYDKVQIRVASGKRVEFSATAKTILKCNIIAESGATVYFDKSWYNMTDPGSVTIDASSGNVKLDTQLLIMPEFRVVGDISVVTVGKPKYTADISFYLFIAILGAVALASIILCIVGGTCLKPDEEIDYSTSSEEKPSEPKPEASPQEEKRS